MTYYRDTFSTPLGAFSIAVDDTGAVAATAFGTGDALRRRLGAVRLEADAAAGRHAREQVVAYFAGERRTFDLSLMLRGTDFQTRVWAELRGIPFGETRSYGALARDLGSAGASRAVGRANAMNPVCLIVPCHRVIGADGSLAGFAFGEEIKRLLLEHEGAWPTSQAKPPL